MNNNLCILSIIKQINTKVRNDLNNNLRKYEITDVQLEVLIYLIKHRNEVIIQRQIEKELSLSNPTIVSVLDRLQEKQLVVRTPGEIDRRQKVVTITPLGIKMHEALCEDFQKEENSLLEGLGEDSQEMLKNLLAMLLENISASKEAAK